ncbi:MAG: PKD domain-containing protein, partial [Bacteroidetes bacterium]
MKKCVFLIALIILSCQTIWAQADFTADTTSGCSPLVINFQDLSNNAVSWQWDFGNGNTSNLKNPGTTYIQPGTYTVRLTIGLSGGGNQTVTKTNYITIHERPQAQFDATNPANCIGDPVQFNDLSAPGSGAITQWLWDFGDGSTSTFSDPTYTFPLVGSYTITLAVRDENGCNSVLVEPNYISVNDYPDASFSADNTLGCDPPFAVQFTSEGTTGLNHFWDFGNGDTSTAVHPNYIFRQRGAFSITHVVYDAAGCSDTVRHEQMVSIGQNEVNIQVSDSVVCLGEPIQFMCGARPGSTVSWDFGDGGNSTSCDVSHSYAAAGTYTASLSITDAEGCTYTGTKTIVIGEAPDANFDTDPALLCEAPFTVNFTNTSVNSGAVTYLWEFSDGATYTTEHVTHTFPDNPPEFQPYLYNISLTVTNEAGCSAVERRVNHIVSGHTVAAIQAMPRSGCAPLAVQFMDSSFSTSTVNSWLWDFGDGNTSSLQNPLHTYADTGLYDVTLTVGTTDGCTSTTVFGQYIDMGQAVAGDFDAAPTLACAQQPIQFNLLTTGVDSVRWLFGDGGESTELSPEHAYTDVGQFDVSLITYKRGCGDTLTKFQFVDIQPPIARFSMSGSIGCQLPFEVIFTDESIGADSWEWDFGDGATSTEQNPRHTYTQAGSYVVTLRVRNSAAGCEYAIDNVVNVVPLDVAFQASDSSGCFPFAVSFTDLSVNAISWEWDFGDGNTSTEPNPTHIYQAPGSYHVQLKVSNVLGCLDSLIRYDYITAWGPDVRFEVVDSSDCAPFNIQFYNNTSSMAPVVAWEWNLGEGPLSNEQAPQHLYTQAGYYDISLTATDSVGCTASDTLFNYILITDPVADFEVSDTLNCPGNEVLFTSLSQGVGLSYLWEFGDGNTSNLANPRHVYTNVGTYAVKLTVTDVNNCPADTVKVDYIVVHEPMVDFTADTTTADCPPLLV